MEHYPCCITEYDIILYVLAPGYRTSARSLSSCALFVCAWRTNCARWRKWTACRCEARGTIGLQNVSLTKLRIATSTAWTWRSGYYAGCGAPVPGCARCREADRPPP